MADEQKAKRPPVDWEAVETEYRAGARSLRDIAAEFGCAESAIRKKAGKEGWPRDIQGKVKQKTDELVRKAEVRSEVRTGKAISEREQIQASATMIADKIINQRADIQRARSIVQKLWDLVDTELNNPEPLAHIGAVMRSPDEFGQDKLNDMYFAVLAIPQQVKNVKLLADALKVLIELERKVLRVDDHEGKLVTDSLTDLIAAIGASPIPVKRNV